jgi:type III secretory pathway component EscR
MVGFIEFMGYLSITGLSVVGVALIISILIKLCVCIQIAKAKNESRRQQENSRRIELSRRERLFQEHVRRNIEEHTRKQINKDNNRQQCSQANDRVSIEPSAPIVVSDTILDLGEIHKMDESSSNTNIHYSQKDLPPSYDEFMEYSVFQ